ncbi:class I SAM-dependent methyltransferase [Ensifer sp. ENS09]|uniref:class I SAM-dependent DNA methyltransferase n=1 Tax=Ensifer sp. ENS09 TaxID=2769263 RepID=UPI00177DBE9D|nr:class I SAM-dependent methyltransferase [Ensifer sp. ENS09]MBD9653126.1 class I SAM-dependent methyltransferase [Ensifer sp. ENS09]
MYRSESSENGGGYSSIASVYDEWMADFDYASIINLLDECQIKRGAKVLDACCGTGRLTEMLSASGATIIGFDRSPEMLTIALERLKGKPNVEFRLADLREDLLLRDVELVTCTLDSMNYLSPNDIGSAIGILSSYIHDGGTLLFDMNTSYKLKEIFGNTTYAESREKFAYIWSNRLSASHIDFDIDIFKHAEHDLYSRNFETHRQFFYDEDVIIGELARNGFRKTFTFDGYSTQPTSPTTQRTVFLSTR